MYLHHCEHHEDRGELLLKFALKSNYLLQFPKELTMTCLICLDHGEAAVRVDLERGDGAGEDVGPAPGSWQMAARVGDGVIAQDALPVRVAHVEIECPATEVLALEIVPDRAEV